MNTTPQMLLCRAQSVRKLADLLPSLAAVAARRRATELELSAWVLELGAGRTPRQENFAA